MRKITKKWVITVSGIALALAVALGRFVYVREQQACLLYPLWAHDRYGFLCEWHYPATNGMSRVVEVCYSTEWATQCYRIEGNRVTDYHWDIDKILWREMWNVVDREKLYGGSFTPQHEKDLVSEEFNLCYQEKWRPHAAREVEERTHPFEADGTGYVTVLAWMWTPCSASESDAGLVSTGSWAIAVCPLDKASPAVNALRDAVKAYMADPSTREHHAAYVRGYPVLSPGHPDRIPMLRAWQDPKDFHSRQRDVLRFIPRMERGLIAIDNGINPFRGFRTPFVPGNSVLLNYRSKKKDWHWYLNGDNFWRVQVYGGNDASGQLKVES